MTRGIFEQKRNEKVEPREIELVILYKTVVMNMCVIKCIQTRDYVSHYGGTYLLQFFFRFIRKKTEKKDWEEQLQQKKKMGKKIMTMREKMTANTYELDL